MSQLPKCEFCPRSVDAMKECVCPRCRERLNANLEYQDNEGSDLDDEGATMMMQCIAGARPTKELAV